MLLLYTKQNTDRMLEFDWLIAGPYACVRTGVWTGWTSVHNNKGKHWLFVVLLVWVYNKALINLEFGPYKKYLLWRHAARTSLRSVRTAWRHNKYFRVWTALSVNNSILLTESAVHTRKYLLWRHAVRTERSDSRSMRALLYTHTSKTIKSQCFPFLLLSEIQQVNTPVRTQAYGPALNQSNFSILSEFCLVYNKRKYRMLKWALRVLKRDRARSTSFCQINLLSCCCWLCTINFQNNFDILTGSSICNNQDE